MLDRPVKKSGARDIAPIVFGGVMLIAAFAFAGHQIGRNAVARAALPEVEIAALNTQVPTIAEKSSLLIEEEFDLKGFDTLRRETVLSDGKTDLEMFDAGEAADPMLADQTAPVVPRPILKPARKIASIAQERVKIVPAAVNLKDEPQSTKSGGKVLVAAAKTADIEKSFKLDKVAKQKAIKQTRVRLAEENCLARAVYFEARSESELGQMAVAKVILNRVKSPQYPNTICGVVYQGTHRRNSCQFSFACDGQPDDVRQPEAWANAKRIAKKALAGDPKVAAKLGGALHYHADYVTPKWARHMRKAIKIGTHIFYTGG
jgi:spore germination cell wall hydrolase CwlJ-like protein